MTEAAVRHLLLEREGELSALAAAVDEVSRGRGRLVVIEGAAGIGKTRLLAAAYELAMQADFRVFKARGGELEREFGFGVVRQLFESSLVEDASVLAGAAAGAAAVFDVGSDPDAAEPSFASLHGLYWLTANLASASPLMITVDDLHWSDLASLRFLAYLVRRLEGLPVLLVCTARSAELDAEAVREIICDPSTMSIKPSPLSVPAAAQLVRTSLGEPTDATFVSACHAHTGGNPLLLVELLRTLGEQGASPDAGHVAMLPDLGSRVVFRTGLVRLGRLSRDAVELARAVAVLGDDAELSTVASLAGTSLDRASAAVAELVSAELLDAKLPLGFVHPLVAAAVHDDMATVDRALAHERAARLLADGGATAERVAAHLLLSPTRGDEWVVGRLTEAARISLRRGAPDSAVAYLERAVREPPPPSQRAQVLLALGRAEALTHGPAAVEHLSEARELLQDPDMRAAASSTLSRTLLLTGQAQAAAGLARVAAAELAPELDEQRRQLEALELAALLIAGGASDAHARLDHYRRRPVGPGPGAKMLAAVAVQWWASAGGDSHACAELALEALADGELIAADNGLLSVMAIGILSMADREEAMDAWELSLAQAHRHGSLFDLKSVTLWRGFTLYWRGELADAEESIRSYYEGKLWGMGPLGHQYADAVLSAVARERGDLTGSRRILERSRDPGDNSEPARFWLHSQLELLVAEGRMSEALAASDEFRRRFAALVDAADTPWRSPTVVALSALGRDDQALALAADDLERARAWGAPGTVARALRTLAAVRADGLELLREAVELTTATPARLQHAKSLAELGAMLRRERSPAEARAPLRRALELAKVLGAERLARRIRSELYAAGARPRRTALTGIGALTPNEMRVAALAAAGRTNRQIAEQLFIAPKTVELHLGNAYRKLEIKSRHQLAAQLQAPSD